MEFIIGWYLLGLIGTIAMWFERSQWKFSRLDFLCPSPKVIVLCVIGALAGPVVFIVGIIILAISGDAGKDSWWQKPICKREDH